MEVSKVEQTQAGRGDAVPAAENSGELGRREGRWQVESDNKVCEEEGKAV